MSLALTRSILIAVALAVPVAARAQTIRGVVLEEGGQTQIAGATVELLSIDARPIATVVSDKVGWFQLVPAEPGRYLVRATHLSYTGGEVDTVTVGKHEIVTVVLHMRRNAIPLAPLIVTARTYDRLAGFYTRAEQGGLGVFVHRPYIERRRGMLPSQLLLMTPGVRLQRDDFGMSNLITISGPGGRCSPSVFLDGLPVPQDVMSIDELTASDLIEGIEIYDRGARIPDVFPIENSNCGVVAFWSRRTAHRPMTWKKVAIGVAALAAFVAVSFQMR